MNSKRIAWSLGLVVLLGLLHSSTVWAQSASLLPQDDGQDLTRTFEGADLSADQLAVFELRSQQLIQEFIDYYELLRTQKDDDELQAILRSELEQLLFDSNSPLLLNGFEEAQTLAATSFAQAPSLSIQHIELIEQGQVVLPLPWRYRLQLSVDGKAQSAQVTTVLFRQLKTFGSTQKEVWQVALSAWQAE